MRHATERWGLPYRLNWGCGSRPAAGWTNSDKTPGEGVHLCCDIRDGLPVDNDTFHYVVSIHGLQDIPILELPAVIRELHRVLKPDGGLRLGLPDLDRAIAAYLRGDAGYFYIPDEDASTLGGKFITQITWYGASRTPFTFDFIQELLNNGGFRKIVRSAYRMTSTPYPDIVELDNRERESLFVEAIK